MRVTFHDIRTVQCIQLTLKALLILFQFWEIFVLKAFLEGRTFRWFSVAILWYGHHSIHGDLKKCQTKFSKICWLGYLKTFITFCYEILWSWNFQKSNLAANLNLFWIKIRWNLVYFKKNQGLLKKTMKKTEICFDNTKSIFEALTNRKLRFHSRLAGFFEPT